MSMTFGGWVFLGLAWGTMLVLITFCMVKVLGKKQK